MALQTFGLYGNRGTRKALAGHSSIRLTLDTYSHVLPTMQRAAVEATADLFRDRPAKSGGKEELPGKAPRQTKSSPLPLPRKRRKPL